VNYSTPLEWKSEAWWRNRPKDERLHHMHIPKRIYENMDGWHHCPHKIDLPNLFIQGPSGCGKSLIAASTLKHLVSEHNCSGRWIEADDYIEMLKDSFDTSDGNLPEMYSSPHIVKYVKAVFDIVVIDGLGEERLSPKYGEDLGFAQHELGSLIRKRYDKGKATIITSRLSIQDIKNRYGSRLANPLADFDHEVIRGKR
jgi:DNA replication protein DnaC